MWCGECVGGGCSLIEPACLGKPMSPPSSLGFHDFIDQYNIVVSLLFKFYYNQNNSS